MCLTHGLEIQSHNGEVNVLKGLYRLEFHNNCAFDEQVNPMFTDLDSIIKDRYFYLLLDEKPSLFEKTSRSEPAAITCKSCRSS